MTLSQETAAPAIVAPQVLLVNHLKALKLPTFAREHEKVAMESAQDRADYPRYLLRLCELERIDRERRNVERRISLARFPQTKSFDTFDFAAQPSLNKVLVLELIRCEWIDKRENCIALGPSGTGKRIRPWGWDYGSCRDFAMLMIEAARALGFAARFASGYLAVPLDNPHEPTLGSARGSTHAWAQIYLLGTGWIDFDPTSGTAGNIGLVSVSRAQPSNASRPKVRSSN